MAAAETIQVDDVDALRRTLEDVARTDNVDALIQLVIRLILNLSNENKRMTLRLQKVLRAMHGRKSEKLTTHQLDLFRELLDSSEEEKKRRRRTADLTRAAEKTMTPKVDRKKAEARKRKNRAMGETNFPKILSE
jgi:hypothetical protein